eukprot:g30665.t1
MRSVVPQPGRAQSGGERTGAPGISLPEARHLPSKSCPSTLSWRFALAISASASCQAGVPRGRRCSLRPAQVSPPNRWDTDLRSKPLPASPVILRSDMKLDEVIRILLSSNAICVKEVNTEDGREDVFYVQVTGPSEAGDPKFAARFALGSPGFCRLRRATCPLGACWMMEKKSVNSILYKEKNVESELSGRLPWLVGLLFFLTVSSAILEYFDGLLQQHLIIAFYLTALALATGELVPSLSDLASVLLQELQVSLGIALVLAGGVALRIVLFGGTPIDAAAIALAMAITVTFSVIFGASAPLILQRLGADPAKVSGPLLSTVIDIAGVLVACLSALAFQALGLW